MEAQSLMDVANLEKAGDFLRRFCGVDGDFLDEFLHKWPDKWTEFEDISAGVQDKVNRAFRELALRCRDAKLQDLLQVATECVMLNKLHDYIVPLIYYQHNDEDEYFYYKCKDLSDNKITAEQFGAPDDYAIPLLAAVVELASLDGKKSPAEKVHCLCTTYDLVFAELKCAIIEIISRSTDKDNEIPIIENYDIIPVLMTVIVRAKVLHLPSNMYYVQNFLWKLQESENVRTTISVFKSTIDRICTVSEENLQPGCEKVCRDLDLSKVMKIMAELETKRKKQEENLTLLDQHMERVSDLIYASTFTNIT